MITEQEKQRWISDLLSGEFQQGTGQLYCKGKYCCLGVFYSQSHTCDQMHVDVLESYQMVEEKISRETTWKLVGLNDDLRKPFSEIAEWIRDNVECSN